MGPRTPRRLTANAPVDTFRINNGEDLGVPSKRRKTNETALTPATIEYLKNKGYNQNQIAEMYGLSKARVSQIKHQVTSFSRTPRERAMDAYPFRVPKPQQECAPDKRLRDHAEYMLTGGKGMAEYKLQRLNWFYKKLEEEGLIVTFDPSNPPTEGIIRGGYKYEQRTAEDGDYLIRFNEEPDLPEEQRILWRFPPARPKV